MHDSPRGLNAGRRLFACDVDGTLARSDGTFSNRTREALAAARAAGHIVVIATGRPYRVALRAAEDLGVECYMVCSNGAMVVDETGTALVDHYIHPEVAPELVPAVRSRVSEVAFGFEFERGVRAEAGLADRLPAGVPLGEPVADILSLLDRGRPVRKLLAWSNETYDLAPLRATLHDLVDGRAHVSSAGLAFVDIGPAGVTKAQALDWLCGHFDIDPAHSVAFGDEMNDLEMLAWAGTGVAVANAVPEAIAASDRVTLSNDDDGVALVIEQLLA